MRPSSRRSRSPTRKNKLGLEVDAATSERLGRGRQHGTAAELAVRGAVHSEGRRYRTVNRDLPGSPDIANRSQKWAIFVHGCFWHRHEGCHRTTTPTRNREFWVAKFAANMARDARAVTELRAMGFRVLVVWECEADAPERLANLTGDFFA